MEAIAWVVLGVLLAMAVNCVRSTSARRRDVFRDRVFAAARIGDRCRCEVCGR